MSGDDTEWIIGLFSVNDYERLHARRRRPGLNRRDGMFLEAIDDAMDVITQGHVGCVRCQQPLSKGWLGAVVVLVPAEPRRGAKPGPSGGLCGTCCLGRSHGSLLREMHQLVQLRFGNAVQA
jgi:hypothetical protein